MELLNAYVLFNNMSITSNIRPNQNYPQSRYFETTLY